MALISNRTHGPALWPSLSSEYEQQLPADILDLQVVEHSPDARVVTVVGEIDALTAPELAVFLTEQLTIGQIVVDLDGVQFLASVGVSVLFEANELATRRPRPAVGVQLPDRRPGAGSRWPAGIHHRRRSVPDASKNSP
jgi:anti-anti-sigma regulatory factor